ncbi:MAG: hypothetical protein KC591_05505 [Gemmatimonadetes bacterium]|nr:hypothetical protein [Gemmatimonadota bacterium]
MSARCASFASSLLIALGLVVPGLSSAAPVLHGDRANRDESRLPEEIRVPLDYPTIQAAIDAAGANDKILIAPGEYDESLQFVLKRDVTLVGAGAKQTIVRSSDTVLTLRQTSGLSIEGIRFETSAEVAVESRQSGVSFSQNVLVATAPNARMDFYCIRPSEFTRNTFVRPENGAGEFLRVNPDFCSGTGVITVRRNLFWTWGKPVADTSGRVQIEENNLGITNAADYPADNLFAFPLFCDPSRGDYTLSAGSPCLPENNPWGRTLGALSQACGPVGVDDTSWGQIKSSYR